MIDKLFYLGPSGSYSEIAKNKFMNFCNKNTYFEASDSIYRIVENLKKNDSCTTCAVLPIENSVEGIVKEVQDSLMDLTKFGYKILAETNININHSLVSFGEKEQIKTIISHPQALAQCRKYINKLFGENIILNPILSTSNAIKNLTPQDITVAAIGSQHCANMYNVPILDNCINDEKNNTTRFILLSQKEPVKSAFNKISIVFSTENSSGALNKILNILEQYQLNMSYIDSRPSKRELGEYVFYVDFQGYLDDVNVKEALDKIKLSTKMFKLLSDGAMLI